MRAEHFSASATTAALPRTAIRSHDQATDRVLDAAELAAFLLVRVCTSASIVCMVETADAQVLFRGGSCPPVRTTSMRALTHGSGCPLCKCEFEAVVRDPWKRLSASRVRAGSGGPLARTHVRAGSGGPDSTTPHMLPKVFECRRRRLGQPAFTNQFTTPTPTLSDLLRNPSINVLFTGR